MSDQTNTRREIITRSDEPLCRLGQGEYERRLRAESNDEHHVGPTIAAMVLYAAALSFGAAISYLISVAIT